MSVQDTVSPSHITERAETPAAPRPNARMTDLEGYRGLAAVGVVVFHAYQFSRGDATASYAYSHTIAGHILRNFDGLVSMFLVLSGFLLFLPVARAAQTGQQLGPAKVFLLRRATRILPLYWSAVALVWAYRNPVAPGDWRDLLEHLTFTQVFDSKRIFYTIGPAWSLSVEVFFYLFLALLYPLLGRVLPRLRTAGGRTMLVLMVPAALGISSLAWQGWALLSNQPATRWAIWFNPLARADMFAAGMLVAIVYARRPTSLSKPALILLRLTALSLLVLGCVVRTDDPGRAAFFNLASTAAFALLIASSVFAKPTDRWRRALSGPRLAWLGLTSYSIYIWHEPVLLFFDTHLHPSHAPQYFPLIAAGLLAVSLPVAWLSYRLVERPVGPLRLILDSDGRRRDYYPQALQSD